MKDIVTWRYLRKFLWPKFWFGVVSKLGFEAKNPDVPWLTAAAVRFLDDYLKPTDVCLEVGSGQSTTWFLKKVAKVYSIESDEAWYRAVLKRVGGSKKLKYKLAETKDEYVGFIEKMKDKSVDICLIDGSWRLCSLLAALPKIKTGGLLVLDNAETHLPVSWLSESMQDGWEMRGRPMPAKVREVLAKLKGWRRITTSDITQDSIFWIRPC